MRADPSLLTELQLGAFLNVYWPARLLRRLFSSAPARVLRSLPFAAATDAAFWVGARSAATDEEWARPTRSSYVVLTYHRLAVIGFPGRNGWTSVRRYSGVTSAGCASFASGRYSPTNWPGSTRLAARKCIG